MIPADLYGGTYRLVDKVLTRWGIAYTMVDQTDLDAVAAAVRSDTKLIWVETPTNPLLNVVDIAGVVACRGRALVAVDNTFATPANQLPLALGADAVVHSTTKYLGGHSDTVGGAVICGSHELHERVRFVQNAVGAVPGPMDCFLVHRGLRTLHLRMRAHAENGAAVSAFLRDDVDGAYDVRWPGFGGMVSFRHPDAVRDRELDEHLHAGRVARRRRVADRGAAGHDAPVRRGLRRRGPGRPRAAVVRHRGGGGSRRGPAPSDRLTAAAPPPGAARDDLVVEHEEVQAEAAEARDRVARGWRRSARRGR